MLCSLFITYKMNIVFLHILALIIFFFLLVVAMLTKEKSHLTVALVYLYARISGITYFPTYLLAQLRI